MVRVTDARLRAGAEVAEYLEEVLTAGARLGVLSDHPLTFVEVVEVSEVTSIRIPSGRLIVDSPWTDEEPRELKERISPGVYRVDAAWVEAPHEFMGEYVSGRECAAIRLCVRDAPVVGWEMGLAVGDDIERLQKGQEVGFETDTAMGCFSDAVAWSALTAPFRSFREACESREPGTFVSRDTAGLCDGYFERSPDESHGADLLTFVANEGRTVVWLGRTDSGSVASIVVVPHLDMLA
ncbi:DUF4241 domain-containing protein [Streptomyces marianii]|uniref:DUF4241 domain-containing protein n=1 Tax=Streptomyces marianii TaxID=1817406 RepID=A0A5R9E871_9ACTN|nr:DUF4241 domain-containing protein [Streptomyces marianii]TLQ46280.1 DUF4241 domain-containing protein [Streptomyces marianii]